MPKINSGFFSVHLELNRHITAQMCTHSFVDKNQ